MKKIILVIALLTPVCLFLFLRFFGKNEFSIPVYYSEGVVDTPNECKSNYSTPYLVSEDVLIGLGWKGNHVLVMNDSAENINRVKQILKDNTSHVELLTLNGVVNKDHIFQCDLLMYSPWTTVLIDDQRRIRGYYAPETREELDRLSLELDILLKNY